MFWLMLVVGMGVGWWNCFRMHEAAELRVGELETYLQSIGVEITWNKERTRLIVPEPTGSAFP
jgi:hypothetical protein